MNQDGERLEGELIEVRPGTLLIVSGDGRDIAVDIAAIDTVRIVADSKVATGLLIGGVAAAVYVSSTAKGDFNRRMSLLLGIPLFGATGTALGGIIGAVSSRSETLKFGGASQAAIGSALFKLRRRARIRN